MKQQNAAFLIHPSSLIPHPFVPPFIVGGARAHRRSCLYHRHHGSASGRFAAAVANLGHLAASLKLIGAEAIVTGVTAQAARSLVYLGVDFAGWRTRRTLAEALATLIKSSRQKNKDGF